MLKWDWMPTEKPAYNFNLNYYLLGRQQFLCNIYKEAYFADKEDEHIIAFIDPWGGIQFFNQQTYLRIFESFEVAPFILVMEKQNEVKPESKD